jgi:hypothetical protein
MRLLGMKAPYSVLANAEQGRAMRNLLLSMTLTLCGVSRAEELFVVPDGVETRWASPGIARHPSHPSLGEYGASRVCY